MFGHRRIDRESATGECLLAAEVRPAAETEAPVDTGPVKGGSATGRSYEKPSLKRLGVLRDLTKRTNSAMIQNNGSDHSTTVTW